MGHLNTPPSPSYRPLGRMPLFRSGKAAYFNGREVTVGHVLIRKGRLLVHLNGLTNPVPSEHIDMEPSELVWPSDRLEGYARHAPVEAGMVVDHPADEPLDQPEEASADDIFAQAVSSALLPAS